MKGFSRRSAHLLTLTSLTVFAAVGGFFGQVQGSDVATGSGATLAYSDSPSALVLAYDLRLGEIAEDDRGPTLRIYGNGRAAVHYPPYMSRAGDYVVELTEGEMAQLLGALLDNGVLEFDATAARAKAREIDRVKRERDGALSYVSDPSTTSIEVYLDRYAPSGPGGPAATNLVKKILWTGIESNARQYPTHEEIQKLAAFERALFELMRRQDLVKVTPAAPSASAGDGHE